MTKRYAVLRSREFGSVFWSPLEEDETEESIRHLSDGTLAYDVLAVCETKDEAQRRWAEEFFLNGFQL